MHEPITSPPSLPDVVTGLYKNVWSYFCRDCQHFEQPFSSRAAAMGASFRHVCPTSGSDPHPSVDGPT